MKYSFAFFSKQRFLLLCLYAAVAMAFLAPISSGTTRFTNLDFANHLSSIVEAKMAIAEGQFPLRVEPFEHSGWRYPLFQFYSPSVYLLSGLTLRWLTPGNPVAAYDLTLWMFLILGGVYMNRLAFWFVKSRPAALLASLAYLASPYYLIVINHLAAFSEAIALGIMPATLYYTLQRFERPTENRTLLQAALFWYLLATAHIVTFVYTAIFAAMLLILVTLKNKNHWRNLGAVGAAFVFGCILAMWYLGPALLFGKLLRVSEAYDVNAFAQYGASLANLLTPAQNIWNIEPDPVTRTIKTTAQIHPNIGIPMLLAACICFYVFFKKLESKRHDYLPILFIMFGLSILIAWSPINVWPHLPRFLSIGQYSWRIMSQTIWIGSLLFAWAVGWLFKDTLNEKHVLAGIFLILMTAGIWLPVTERASVPLDLAEVNRNPKMYTHADNYEMSIQKVKSTQTINNAVGVLAVQQVQPYCTQQKTRLVCTLTPPAKTRLLEIPEFYYPDLLSVSINGKAVSYSSVLSQDHFIVAVKPLPNELNIIEIQFRGLQWANSLSDLSWGLWFLLLLLLMPLLRSAGATK